MIPSTNLKNELKVAADLLKEGQILPTEHNYYLLRLLLLKRLSDLEEAAKVTQQKTPESKLAENSPPKYHLLISEGSRWLDLKRLKENVADGLNKALAALETANPEFKGIFTAADWKKVGDDILLKLIEHFSNLNLRNSNLTTPDLLGNISEYLIKKCY